ncbi:hypothetical protein [Streptomyces gardneri]|uniref:hypothetical protein n=1 Tax=Streptomyces gardneri TaxID=66892 RepID=UPI0037D0DDAD
MKQQHGTTRRFAVAVTLAVTGGGPAVPAFAMASVRPSCGGMTPPRTWASAGERASGTRRSKAVMSPAGQFQDVLPQF